MMTYLVAGLFVLTYVGMALGRVPGSQIDRAGLSMIVAVLFVAVGALPPSRTAEAVHFPTLLLLGGLMIVSARVGASGFYDAAAVWIAGRADRPLMLLALTIGVGGLLSAVLVNDIVVFAMTPLLCAGLRLRQVDPRPYLFGLAAASNAGSAATLIGNPQNILIGQVGRLGFWRYAADAAIPSLAALAICFAVIAFVWRSSLGAVGSDPASGAPAAGPVNFSRKQVTVAGIGILALLGLFATPLPRELSALLVAACLIISRKVPTRQLLDEIDVPLLILFAALFIINDAFALTGIPGEGVRALAAHDMLPGRISLMAPLMLVVSNTIGNVPAVIMILKVWSGIPQGALVGLALLSTLAGNLFLVGSLANLIVAERAAPEGIRLTFAEHARAGVPITVLSMAAAGLWLWAGGLMAP
jgi:Na+/H+ antiporter NhaD/arsenite permease-like protein